MMEVNALPLEGCTLMCGVLCTICSILSWYALVTGDWNCIVITLAFSVVIVLLAGYALAMRYAR